MAVGNTIASGLAGRYAGALLELAEEKKQLDKVAAELGELKKLVAGSEDLTRLTQSPVYSSEEQTQAMEAILDKAGASDLTRRFVLTVAQNRRLFALTQMIDGYLEELARRRGEVVAEVTAARALTPEQRETLEKSLRDQVGAKVKVDLKIDPSLLGGLIVRVGSRMIDASIRSKLEKLQLAMKGVG